jgi:hypothetical protein
MTCGVAVLGHPSFVVGASLALGCACRIGDAVRVGAVCASNHGGATKGPRRVGRERLLDLLTPGHDLRVWPGDRCRGASGDRRTGMQRGLVREAEGNSVWRTCIVGCGALVPRRDGHAAIEVAGSKSPHVWAAIFRGEVHRRPVEGAKVPVVVGTDVFRRRRGLVLQAPPPVAVVVGGDRCILER